MDLVYILLGAIIVFLIGNLFLTYYIRKRNIVLPIDSKEAKISVLKTRLENVEKRISYLEAEVYKKEK